MPTFAVELPARKVRVNGAERQPCALCACQGLRCAPVVLPGEEHQIWRMCCLFGVALFSSVPTAFPHSSFFLVSKNRQCFLKLSRK